METDPHSTKKPHSANNSTDAQNTPVVPDPQATEADTSNPLPTPANDSASDTPTEAVTPDSSPSPKPAEDTGPASAIHFKNTNTVQDDKKDQVKTRSLAELMNKQKEDKTGKVEVKTSTVKVMTLPRKILTYGVAPAIIAALLIFAGFKIRDFATAKDLKNPKYVMLSKEEIAARETDQDARSYLANIETVVRFYNTQHKGKYPQADSFAKLIPITKKEYNIVVTSKPKLPKGYKFLYCSTNGQDYNLNALKDNTNLLKLGTDKCTPQ